MHKHILIFIFILSPLFLFAQNTTPKYSNEFLSIGVGARALSMANTQVAITDDVTAAYWNPAGLLNIEDKYQVSVMHAAYFGGIANYDYVGFSTAINEKNRMGISLIRFGIDDIPDTRFLIDDNGGINYDRIGSFSEASYAFLFSYARELEISYKSKSKETQTKFTHNLPLRLGANFKIIRRVAGEFANAWGFGLDIGVQTEIRKWKLGIMGRDITTTFNAWSFNEETFSEIFAATGNQIPVSSTELTLPRILLGVGRTVYDKNNFSVLVNFGLENTFDGKRNTLIKTNLVSISPSMGTEFAYKNKVFVRGGIGNFQQITDFDGSTATVLQPNFGLGVKIKGLVLDYALTNIGEQGDIPFSHVFSLRIAFDDKDLRFMKAKKE
jgi:hypothetical protein